MKDVFHPEIAPEAMRIVTSLDTEEESPCWFDNGMLYKLQNSAILSQMK